MRCVVTIFILSLLFLSGMVNSHSAEVSALRVQEIRERVDSLNNKVITVKLRFKKVEFSGDKIDASGYRIAAIVFYDDKNHDIEFDITELQFTDSYRREALNLHSGMRYLVTFRVKKVKNLTVDNTVVNDFRGELISFTPDFLGRLPL